MAAEASYPGVGDRLKQQLQKLGYWKDDRPDVQRFCLEKGYITQSFYGWLSNGTVPSYENIMRLSRDLKVDTCWLLLGDYAHKKR